MPDQLETSNNKKTLNIPSYEQVEKLLANQSNQLPNLFRSKRALASESVLEDTSPATTPPPSVETPPAVPTLNTFSSSASNVTPNYSRGGNTILVKPTQQKNPILKHIHNVPWEPSDYIKADFVVGQTTGIVYLSLKYHRLYPTYIYDRLQELQSSYVGRILLVYVDIDAHHDSLREINRVAILSDFTLMLAWSLEEAGRYLESYKWLQNKSPDFIREKVGDEYLAKVTDCLTSIKSVNKTDVLTLLSTFGCLKGVAGAKAEELAMCPGFGEQKVKRVQQVWKQPFLANKKSRN
ncbi:restriction endonuclease type II-like protein [Helicostylum pulchrum]|nr:restriction endonuclease type II-like protein [Helicostylum pulchrum]